MESNSRDVSTPSPAAGHALSLGRYRRSVLPDGPLLPLDAPRLKALEKAQPEVRELLDRERRRLRALEQHERKARREGHALVAGVDEVGRGPLAGPLVAAAVIFVRSPWIPLLDDSKLLSEEEREALFPLIQARAHRYGIGVVSVEELNHSNMHRASLEAMRRAIGALGVEPDCVLVDGCHKVPTLSCRQVSLVKGDRLSASIAAASILAKVTRDRTMDEMDSLFPDFGFRRNKGYATPEHLDALGRVGPCPIHRALFAPVAIARGEGPRQLELFG